MDERGGTYALYLKLDEGAEISVGRLGVFSFPAGYYVYVGSALGSGGLRARLARHQRRDNKLHWHIDYFLTRASIVGVQVDFSGERLECHWAQLWLRIPGAQIIAPRFGASDCHCIAHLIYAGKDNVFILAFGSA